MNTSSKEWRLACEVRYVADLPEERRRAFYLDVKKHRGEKAAQALVDAVNARRRQAWPGS